ncbi:thiol reductant ABC exporter subunit CydC [Gordonia sp. HNM0687]|uniref:Thiol reductant ABC exporter subunit CydC n=1 Tax=Gordonia mangrovi TaxID=2665643 RepID=A0A6L7GX93_9ACTN|nr:thiol reductant ABC exporter subunit CydC [Gordonia mangrovi]MXP23245.1 thiol reductant ABC exporter subunit CydC [Gordonia mangrovi]UVF80770.1 thiol reductant ABC exporter subunit CydC [Gordonia mangrovi]
MMEAPLRRAFAFLGLRGRPLVKSILLGVGGALSALGLAALSAWLITRAWQMPPVLYLSVAITAVRALGISRGVFRYLERLATHDLALGAMATARERVYRTLAAGSPAYSVSLRRAELLGRTGDDIDEIGNALIRGVIPIAVGAVTSVAAVVIMALVSWWAAAVLAVALIVSGLLAPAMAARGSARTIADSAAANDRAADAAVTALWHAPELTVARRRGAVLDIARRSEAEALAATDRGLRYEAAASAATPLSLGASLVAACLIGVHLASQVPGSLADVASGEGLTPMILGVLILLPLSAFESTGPLTEAGIQLERSRQSARRVMSLVDRAGVDVADGDADPDATDRTIYDGPVTIQMAGLRWGWPAGPPLGPAGGLDLRLSPGDRWVIVGPSGAGKTTLGLTLTGLLAPRVGHVDIRDQNGDAVDVRSSTCYFAEEGHLFSTTLRENLLVARGDATDEELVAALGAVGLRSWLDGLADGLDTDLVGGAAAVSGGQRRRLLLARAVLHPAPVVVLDEPTEHLDADDSAAMLQRILGRSGDLFDSRRIVVVITHHPAVQQISTGNPRCAVFGMVPPQAG